MYNNLYQTQHVHFEIGINCGLIYLKVIPITILSMVSIIIEAEKL